MAEREMIMKRVENSTVSPGEDIDALLGAFFKGEMPDPWPAFQPPRRTLPFRPAEKKTPPPRFVISSRMALAAAVALLTLCGWLLSGSLGRPTAGPSDFFDPSGKPKANKSEGGHHLFRNLPTPKGDAEPAGKVRSAISLEPDSIRITVEELPSRK